MIDKFIPIDDFATFEGITYRALLRRMERNPENYKTKTEPNENGGRDKVFVAVSSLSKAAQRRYRASIAKKRTNTDDIPGTFTVTLTGTLKNTHKIIMKPLSCHATLASMQTAKIKCLPKTLKAICQKSSAYQKEAYVDTLRTTLKRLHGRLMRN